MDFDPIWKIAKEFQIIQKKQEMQGLFDTILELENRDSFLEIGTQNGGTAAVFLHLFKEGVSIDQEYCPGANELLKINPNFKQIIGNSHNQFIIDSLGDCKFDMIFIDACHTLEAVTLDFNNYKQYLNQGGIIAFHDVYPDNMWFYNENINIKPLWDDLKTKYRFKEYYSIDENTDCVQLLNYLKAHEWGGIGVIWLD